MARSMFFPTSCSPLRSASTCTCEISGFSRPPCTYHLDAWLGTGGGETAIVSVQLIAWLGVTTAWSQGWETDKPALRCLPFLVAPRRGEWAGRAQPLQALVSVCATRSQQLPKSMRVRLRQPKAPRTRLEGEETQHNPSPVPHLSFLVFVAVSMVKTGWHKALLPVTFFFNGNE